MNIAIFASQFYPHIGGVEELVHQLSREYRRLGHKVIIITNRWPRSLPAYENFEGIPIYRLAMRVPVGSFKAYLNYHLTHRLIVQKMVRIIKKYEINIIHVQCVSSNAYYALLAKRRLKLPLVITLQGELTMDATGWYKSNFGRSLLCTVLKEADAITACSGHTLREAERFCGVTFGVRGHIIHNGVCEEEFINTSSYSHPRPYVFAVGRLVPQKGFDILLRAFSLLVQAGDKTHDLLLAGDGFERTNLERLCDELGLADRVYFLGKTTRPETASLFTGASFFVLPSRSHEGLPLVSAEAMAAGKAVIASRMGGTPEIVEDNETGLLIPPEDVHALSNAMFNLEKDSALRDRLGKKGRIRAHNFSWSAIAEQYLDIYRQIV